MSIFECVPNFSEGRNDQTIGELAAAARSTPGVTVLDVERNADHNRSMISLVGEGAALSDALLSMMRVATARIDLTHHIGEHPRMGATDVVPFVPLFGATLEEAATQAAALGERIWNELRIPVYLYGAAARRPERADLAAVRKGQFEGIRGSIATDPARIPDFGERAVHPTAGSVAVGARPVLIAYNVYLSTPDVAVAKQIAHAVRGRDGGLPEVKALGFDIQERHQAQVSMNLTDYRTTPIPVALEAVRREAAKRGTSVDESEIVGLVPEDALFDAAEYYLALKQFDRATILERKLRAAATEGTQATLVGRPLRGFVEALARRTPTPGGGSAAAAAGAMGAGLGEMVVAYSQPKDALEPELANVGEALRGFRERLLQLVDEDAVAYERVRAARRAARAGAGGGSPSPSIAEALRNAANVPLETARMARRAQELLSSVEAKVKPTIRSDFDAALALLIAARQGGLANVAINLSDLRGAGESVDDLERESGRLAEPVGTR